jgi:hypothetical protein
MKTFYQFLENTNSSLVKTNLENLKNNLTKKIEDFFVDFENETERLKNFKLDLNYVKKELKDYPKINDLIFKLSNSKQDWQDDLWNWQRSLSSEDRYKVFSATRYLWKYLDSLDERKIDKKEYYDSLNKVLEKTNKNMIEIKNNIEKAISQSDWNGSTVSIYPLIASSEEDFLSPSDSAEIKVGNKLGNFQLWKENEKFIIEDILESDEEESSYFFTNNEEKQDYYNLISQLQNPNKKDQILTLYTARPTKDREFYSKTDYLPANIFLSNSFNHVDGLAGDLQGTEERRDIYKVKINSKYLIKTLDGPVKYYQVVKDAPVQYIDLY